MREEEFLQITEPSEYVKEIDFHLSKTAPVGFIGKFAQFFPEIIGGDAGCGFLCAEVELGDVDYVALETYMAANVPFQDRVPMQMQDIESLYEYSLHLKGVECSLFSNYSNATEYLSALCGFNKQFRCSIELQSLGTGNHFVEIGKGEAGTTYVTIHTGSRSAGIVVFREFQVVCELFKCSNSKTKEDFFNNSVASMLLGNSINIPLLLWDQFRVYVSRKFREETPHLMKLCRIAEYSECNEILPLPEEFGAHYKRTVDFLTVTAHISRCAILKCLSDSTFVKIRQIISSRPHNYIFQDKIFKGAELIQAGSLFIVALNCRDGILLCKSEKTIYAPHGAGRVLSRTEAAQCESQAIAGLVRFWKGAEEEPVSYKPGGDVESQLKENGIVIVDHIKAVYNYKQGA